MKTLIVLTFLTIASISAHAGKTVPLTVTITATASVQGLGFGGAGFTNIDLPTRYSVTTKSILATLAQDEFFDGHYPSGAFPSGSKLVFMNDIDDFSQSYFEVVDNAGFPILNVSDLIHFTQSDDNYIQSGQLNTDTGLVANYKQTFIGTLSFDDTASASPGDHVKFYLRGVVQGAASDAKPKNGSYAEKWTMKMSGGGGAGIDVGVVNTMPLIISGSISLTGSKTFSVQ